MDVKEIIESRLDYLSACVNELLDFNFEYDNETFYEQLQYLKGSIEALEYIESRLHECNVDSSKE